MKFFKSFAVVNICLLFFVLFLAYFVQPPDIVSGCEAKAEEKCSDPLGAAHAHFL